DRVVDETGGQTVVFGRRGGRPFHLNEMERFYVHSDLAESKDGGGGRGTPYRVEDVLARDGKLMTKSGVMLEPVPMPSPTGTPAALGSPDIARGTLPTPS